MKRLHISLLGGGNNPNAACELEILQKYTKLCVEIASARSWSQAQYLVTLPCSFAVVHHADRDERVKGLRVIKKLWESVLKAEQVLLGGTLDADVNDSLQQIMNHLAWNKGQVARELFLVCQNGNWSPFDAEIRELGFYLFGTPANTKHFLEDAFSHLADVVKRFARNFKMSKYLTTN